MRWPSRAVGLCRVGEGGMDGWADAEMVGGEQEVAAERGGGFKRLKLICRPPQLSTVFGELKCACVLPR